MKLSPYQRKAISDDVVDKILSLVTSQELKPGDRLPSERELADMLAVSRPSLREGLRTLSYLNILETRTGSGTHVRSLDTASLVEPLGYIFEIDDSTIFDLLLVRQINEPAICAIAAQVITDEELAQLNATMQELDDNEDNIPDLLELDIQLHKTIIDAAKNPVLSRVMESVWQLSRMARQRTIRVDTIRQQASIDHHRIVDALNARSPEEAHRAMADHIVNIEAGLKSIEADL